jgi:mRNA-degrading endonuclease RelE of RelBE toxin-antitoxin system
MYTIKFTEDGLRDVKGLPRNVKNTLKEELTEKLMTNPQGYGEPLHHSLEGWYSFHYLEYRVVYKIFEDLLAVGIAGIGKHDKDAEIDIYRRLEGAAKAGKLAESVLVALQTFSRPPSGPE